MAGVPIVVPHDVIRRLDYDGIGWAVRLPFVRRYCRCEDQEDRRADEGRVRKAHAQREVPGVGLQRNAGEGIWDCWRGEAGAHGEPVRTRYPERRAGEARRKE